jgi:hypothetical protein
MKEVQRKQYDVRTTHLSDYETGSLEKRIEYKNSFLFIDFVVKKRN